MVGLALKDDDWDVVMTGFNLINPSARHSVLKQAQDQNVGTLIMLAVRRALSNQLEGLALVEQLVTDGALEVSELDVDAPFEFLTESGASDSLTEAAYRFCRHEPGACVVLTGTGSIDHLAENLRAVSKPALPAHVLERQEKIFGRVDCVSGN